MSEVQNTNPETPVKQKRVTNMDRAREIYAASPDKSRKEIIRLFQEQIPGMAQATASTYYYQVAPEREKRVPNVAKAREIYAAAPEKSRKALVPKFMELGMSENVASTYFYNCKRYFAELAAAEVAADSASDL